MVCMLLLHAWNGETNDNVFTNGFVSGRWPALG
jgi:hypothetical protein